MASLAFKPVQARKLSDALKKKHSESLKGPAAAAQVEAPPVRNAPCGAPSHCKVATLATLPNCKRVAARADRSPTPREREGCCAGCPGAHGSVAPAK